MPARRYRSESKEYVRKMPATWWLQRPAYTKFIARELSSLFCAGYAVLLVVMVARSRDAGAFAELWAMLKSPVSIFLHLLVLGFSLLNTITTFLLAPSVLVIRRGEDRVSGSLISGAHFAAWAVVSAVVLIVVLRSG